MKGKCEIFNKGCTGCEGLLYDIDNLKLECETYQKYMNEGEQMKCIDCWKFGDCKEASKEKTECNNYYRPGAKIIEKIIENTEVEDGRN